MRKIIYILILVTSCGNSLNYDLVIRSNVNVEIDHACLEINGQRGVWGVLAPKSSASRANISFPIPEQVKITWKNTATDEDHQFQMDVLSKVPEEFDPYRDDIIFTIQPDNTVTLSFKIQTGQYTSKEIKMD